MTGYQLKPDAPRPRRRRQQNVLAYRSPLDRIQMNRLAALPGAIGFFCTLGACAGAFHLFAATWQESRGVRVACLVGTAAAVVVLAMVRIPLQQHFNFSGFGRGVLAGTMLGMFVPAPCAGYYVLTIVLF